jgi:hypothetical protein
MAQVVRGARSKSDRLLDRLANSRGDNLTRIVDAVIKLAESGEKWAAEAILARTWPAPKGRVVKLDLPVGLGIDGIAAAFDRIIAAVNAGAITPDEALACAALLEKQAAMLERKDVEARLAALEREAA